MTYFSCFEVLLKRSAGSRRAHAGRHGTSAPEAPATDNAPFIRQLRIGSGFHCFHLRLFLNTDDVHVCVQRKGSKQPGVLLTRVCCREAYILQLLSQPHTKNEPPLFEHAAHGVESLVSEQWRFHTSARGQRHMVHSCARNIQHSRNWQTMKVPNTDSMVTRRPHRNFSKSTR